MDRFCLLVFSAVASLLLPVWALARPAGSATVIVAAAPWAPAARVLDLVAHADGSVLRGTGWAWVVVARSDEPGFAGRLAAAGAWLVIDGAAQAGCTGWAAASRRIGS